MKRREFIGVVAGAAAWPLAVRAQEAGRTYRIGFLTPVDRPAYGAFFDELRLNGFIEGRNLEVAPGGFALPSYQISEAAAALVKTAPDAIIAGPEPPLRALQFMTQTIPLLSMVEDMVAAGLVASLSRPGGNTTGISLMSPSFDGKRQDILIEAVPGMRRIAALVDTNSIVPHLQVLQEGARARGVTLQVIDVARRDDVLAAIDSAKASGAEAINFLASPMFSIRSAAFIERVTALRLPSIFQWPENAEEGALAGYGPRFSDLGRQRARQLIKVLRGAKPADIPVEQPTRFELVINLKTARAIGHEVPAGLVLHADKLIE
jgi:putative tryptophan/tyrosine transport system substrate-binding protein